MEKGPKIKKNFGGDEAIPEFQKRELEIELRPEPKGSKVESPEKLEGIEWGSDKTWFELVYDAKHEFPEEVQILLDKQTQHKPLSPGEQSMLDLAVNKWWKESFGIIFANRKKPLEDIPGIKQQKEKGGVQAQKVNSMEDLQNQKHHKMEQLHQAFKNLDEGEPVDEFRDETRRILHFDENNSQYFLEEGGNRKYLGIGDIQSDYAWGIKYVPDGEMIEPAYRTITKRILFNEARRSLEIIHNRELITQRPYRSSTSRFYTIWPRIKDAFKKENEGIPEQQLAEKLLQDNLGWIIEVAVREFFSRITLNNDLDFVVSRATAEEDADFKYDFKIRVKRRLRGINVQSQNLNSVGFQLKSELKRKGVAISSRKKKRTFRIVDEILTLKVPGRKFEEALKKWFKLGEPSGGPEQFLSKELKIAILKAVTEKLADIPKEVFDKLE